MVMANSINFVFHTFCLVFPALSDENFLSMGFHMTCHIFRLQGIANTQLRQTNFFFALVSTILVIFSDFKELQIFQVMFSTLLV